MISFRTVLAIGAAVTALSAAAVELKTTGDVRWTTGGVGVDERNEMVKLLPDYNFKLVAAAEKTGAFLADVRVEVRDASQRTVLETTLDGPVLLARLPPGRYELIATYSGKPLTRVINVPTSGRRDLSLYWPAPDVEMMVDKTKP